MGVIGMGFLLGLAGCTSGGPAGEATVVTPRVDHPGATIVRSIGPQLEVTVDYGFARASLGQRWMILQVAVSGSRAAATEIPRSAVSLRTPAGEDIPLPTYPELVKAYPEVQSAARRAVLATGPLDFTRGDRRLCRLGFLPLPQTDVALESVWVNYRQLCVGFLYFPISRGIRPGTYELRLDLKGGTIAVPFTIGASPE